VSLHRTGGFALTLVLLIASGLAACGGDDSGGKSGTGTGSDDEFVKGLCEATSRFAADFEKAFAGPTPEDFAKAIELLFKSIGAPFQRFSDSFSKLKPPPDLADWHRDASQKLAAATKALKDGNFADPSLAALSDNPVPEMPAGAQQRLEAIAAKTGACKGFDPFTGQGGSGGFGGSGGAPTPALKDAAKGAWTGRFGTIQFNPDGTARFAIKNCGLVQPSDQPFGAVDTCDPEEFTGKVEVGAYSYTLRDKDGVGNVFAAYVDSAKRLHVGMGTVSTFGPGHSGVVEISFRPLNVSGDQCTRKEFGSNKETKVNCRWTKEQGKEVLEVDSDFGSPDRLVILPDEGLAVSPEIYVASFEQKR